MPSSPASSTTAVTASDATPRRRRAAAPAPTGKNVPTDPPKQVDPVVQAAMELVRPAPGYVLAKLMLAPERAELLELPADTTALLEAAFVRILALHPSDDDFAREYPVGSVVVASLEGIAPLLVTHAFLLPNERIMGSVPVAGVAAGAAFGFEH